MNSTTVNDAWPAANEIAAGATPPISTATGSSAHSSVVFVPIASTTADPMTNPATVPASARANVWPVLSALERRIDRVPKDTQKACSTPISRATSTASASAAPPRRLLCNDTEVSARCAPARSRIDASRPPIPAGSRPIARASQPRAAAAANTSMLPATWITMKPASWARNAGSSEETNARTSASLAGRCPGRGTHTPAGSAAITASSPWRARTSAAADPPGCSSASAPCASAAAAALCTATTRAPPIAPVAPPITSV